MYPKVIVFKIKHLDALIVVFKAPGRTAYIVERRIVP